MAEKHEDATLVREVRSALALSRPGLGQVIGTSGEFLFQVEHGLRPLPASKRTILLALLPKSPPAGRLPPGE